MFFGTYINEPPLNTDAFNAANLFSVYETILPKYFFTKSGYFFIATSIEVNITFFSSNSSIILWYITSLSY